MTDIFLSYDRDDSAIAKDLVKALEAKGWTVWIDTRIEPGTYWDEELEAALNEAGCVVVLWSNFSIQSQWVMLEAKKALDQNKLVPARLYGANIPMPFTRIQAANLAGWNGEPHSGFDQLTKRVAAVIAGDYSLLNKWMAAAAPLLPALVWWTLSLMRVSSTEASIDLNLSGLTFRSSRTQTLLDTVPASLVDASGFGRLELDNIDQSLDPAVPVVLRAPSGEGQVTLERFGLEPGTEVAIDAGPAGRCQLSLAGATTPLSLSIQGTVELMKEGDRQRLALAKPSSAQLSRTSKDANLDLRLTGDRELLPAPLAVQSLALTRLDRHFEDGRTVLKRRATVLSGTLRLEDTGRTQTLGAATELQMDEATGELTTLEIKGGQIHTQFRGRARRLRICPGGNCEDLTPRWSEWLWARQQPAILTLLTLYLIACGWLVVRSKLIRR